jgi:hypothetical protein
MTATESHAEFLKSLTDLVNKFHEEHKDLFINDIDIVSDSDPTGAKVVLGIQVRILAQPERWNNES